MSSELNNIRTQALFEGKVLATLEQLIQNNIEIKKQIERDNGEIKKQVEVNRKAIEKLNLRTYGLGSLAGGVGGCVVLIIKMLFGSVK